MSRLNATQASITAAFIFIVGQIVALVPSLGAEKTQLLSIGTTVITVVFLLVHLGHAAIGVIRDFTSGKVKVTLGEMEGGIRSLAQDEIGKVNLSQKILELLSGRLPTTSDITGIVQAELRKLLGQGQSPAPATVVNSFAGDAPASPATPPAAPAPDITQA